MAWFDQFADTNQYTEKVQIELTLTSPIGLPPHTPIAQKIAEQRWLIANLAKIGTFLYKMMWLKAGKCE